MDERIEVRVGCNPRVDCDLPVHPQHARYKRRSGRELSQRHHNVGFGRYELLANNRPTSNDSNVLEQSFEIWFGTMILGHATYRTLVRKVLYMGIPLSILSPKSQARAV